MRHTVIAFLCFFLFISGATAWSRAQSIAVAPVTPRVLSGADVGFRVEGLRGNTPVGQVVVRVNGQWIAAELASGITRPAQTSR
jgi:hypothetical protein